MSPTKNTRFTHSSLLTVEMRAISLVFLAVIVRTFSADVKEGAIRLVCLSEDKPYFTAAILEHARLGNWSTEKPSEIISKNLDFYKRAARIAKFKDADIIAFPEYGIIPFIDEREKMKSFLEEIPDPKERRWNPCEQSSEFSSRIILTTLSCMAKENEIVVVADMGDIQPCVKEKHNKCPDDGTWHYNANVVFDRDGTLLALYRKEHLFCEKGMDKPPEPQNPVFKTDFGTFSMYICFDSIFKHMALSGRNKNVDGVILTTMWVDSPPVLNAVQHWQSWATGNDATLIAANGQLPGYGAVGSGVFTGKMGALKYTSHPDGLSKLIVSRAPRYKNQSFPFYNDASITVITGNGTEEYELTEDEEGADFPDICDFDILGKPSDIYRDYRCIQEKMSKYTLVKLTEPKGTVEACSNGLCCSLSYVADSIQDSFYLAVYNGTYNSYDLYFWCEEKCFVSRCDDFNGTECSLFPPKSETTFSKLELKANFSTDFIYPSVIKAGFRLTPVDEWSYSVVKEDGSYAGHLVYDSDSRKPLLAAVLSGRCYDRDPPNAR